MKSSVLVVDALPLVEYQQHTKRSAIRREGMPEVDEIVCVQPPKSWTRDFYYMVAQFNGKTAGLYPVATDNRLISVRIRASLPKAHTAIKLRSYLAKLIIWNRKESCLIQRAKCNGFAPWFWEPVEGFDSHAFYHYVRFAHSPPFFSFWEEGAISFPSSRLLKFDF